MVSPLPSSLLSVLSACLCARLPVCIHVSYVCATICLWLSLFEFWRQLPQWVITDFNTFVCTACSGIHREFSHRVKSISLATFTEDEVKGVKAGGNEISNKLYMARWAQRDEAPG